MRSPTSHPRLHRSVPHIKKPHHPNAETRQAGADTKRRVQLGRPVQRITRPHHAAISNCTTAACALQSKRSAIFMAPRYWPGSLVPDGAAEGPVSSVVLCFIRVLCFLCFFRVWVVVVVSVPEAPTAPEICGVADIPDCVPYCEVPDLDVSDCVVVDCEVPDGVVPMVLLVLVDGDGFALGVVVVVLVELSDVPGAPTAPDRCPVLALSDCDVPDCCEVPDGLVAVALPGVIDELLGVDVPLEVLRSVVVEREEDDVPPIGSGVGVVVCANVEPASSNAEPRTSNGDFFIVLLLHE